MSKRPHKYRAVPTVIDGIRFASKKEAARYCDLKMLEKAKQIRKLELQPVYPLFAHTRTITERGKMHYEAVKVATYKGDFRYEVKGLSACENERWHAVVEDVKGFKTPVYRLKKKWVEAQYGIEIREV
jgi:beta-xylosidase